MMNLGWKPDLSSSKTNKPRLIYKPGSKLVDWKNPDNYYTLKEELKSGLSYGEIALKYSETPSCIRGGARKHGLKSISEKPRGPGRQLTIGEKKTIEELMIIGCSVQKCAEVMNIPLSSMQRMMKDRTKLIQSSRVKREALIAKTVEKYRYG